MINFKSIYQKWRIRIGIGICISLVPLAVLAILTRSMGYEQVTGMIGIVMITGLLSLIAIDLIDYYYVSHGSIN